MAEMWYSSIVLFFRILADIKETVAYKTVRTDRKDDRAIVTIYIIFLILTVLNMLFNGFRAAIDNVSDMRIDELAEKGDPKAKKIQDYLDEPTDFSYHIQLLSVLDIALLVFAAGIQYSDRLWVAAVFLLLMLFVGVFIPQKIGSRRPDKWAFGLVKTIRFFFLLITPLYWILDKCSDAVVRIQGLNPDESVDDVTEDEIISMVKDGHEQGVLQESEAEMIHNIFEFDDKEAKDIMTHRKHIKAIDAESTLVETIRYMIEKNNSRFPVYEENFDNMIGMIHIKDVLTASQDKACLSQKIKDIDGLVRSIDLIPETRNINTLFQEMQSNKNHMVIVVDEYGQTAGLVAMEDIIEEIVGNILDEYDEDETMITPLSNDCFLMKGMAPLEEVQEALKTELDIEEYETLNGYLISKIDKIPGDGDTFTVNSAGWTFHVFCVKNKLIQSVRVEREKEKQ